MAEHDYGSFDYCVRCGASQPEVEDGCRPPGCQAAPNVVAIADVLAVRAYNRDIAPVHGRYLKERRR